MGVVNLVTLFIVSGFSGHLPGFMPGSSIVYACLIMLVIVFCTTIFGMVAFYKAGKRENNMVLANSTDLKELLDEMNERLKRIEER